jgi:hypothetical protein
MAPGLQTNFLGVCAGSSHKKGQYNFSVRRAGMESNVMQLPIYVKVICLIGAVLIVFLLAAWELVNDWIASAAKALRRTSKSFFSPKKPFLPKRV